VQWKAPPVSAGSALTAYVVTPYLNGIAQPARVLSPHATRAKIGGLIAGRTYTFRIAARNRRGEGAQSSPSNAVMIA
jgi:hypothetical protein